MMESGVDPKVERGYQRNEQRFKQEASTKKWIKIGAIGACCLAISIMALQNYQDQPLNPRQAAIITALIHQVAAKDKATPQAAWADLNRRLGVRSHDDLRRRDYDRAESILLDALGVSDGRT